jgi:hypothetical protein
MRAVLAENSGNMYSGFSDDPFQALCDLAFDLTSFATAFLVGDELEFRKCVDKSLEWELTKGFARLP